MRIICELDGIEELNKLKLFLCGADGVKSNADLPIGELRLPLRVNACLNAEGIKTIGDLLKWSEVDLLKTPNIGKKALNEIKDALYNRGLFMAVRSDSA